MRKKTFGYHLKDARSINEVIKRKIVDVIITSPPYAEMKDYGMEGQIGFGQDYIDEYLPDLKHVFSECHKITKATGSLWVIMDTFRANGGVKMLPFDIAKKLEEAEWKLKDIIIWEKDKALPWTRKGQLRNIFEYILFFVKTEDYKYHIDRIKELEFKQWWVKYPERYNPQGKVPTNIWNISIPIQGSWSSSNLRHFCPFPTELIEKILLLSSDEGDVVLDPFAGSGIVLAQATCMKRKAIGFDINQEYKDMYENYILNEVKERWRLRKKEIRGNRSNRIKMEKQIKELRQLKYPKVLFKELVKSHNIGENLSSIITIFAFSIPIEKHDQAKSHLFLKEKIFVVVEDEINRDLMMKEINEIVSRPPLSKFGILSVIQLISFRNFIKTLNKDPIFTDNSQFWLYSEGRTHKFQKSITIDEWKEYGKNFIKEDNAEINIPLIVSNIKIDI